MFIEEKGFKESVNLCLAIEQQWLSIQSILALDLDEHSALQLLSSILRLMTTLSRSDAKVLLIQELSSVSEQTELLDNMEGVVEVSSIKLKCEEVAKKLAMGPRILAAGLIADPFLSQCYYQQINIYDAALCNTWRRQSTQEIKLQVQYWIHSLSVVYQACELILWMMRSRGSFISIAAENGYYRDKEVSDLLRLNLVRIKYLRSDVHPSVSIAHRWLVVTFYSGVWNEGSYQHIQLKDTINAEVALCF